MNRPVLEVSRLSVTISTPEGTVRPVSDVTLRVRHGEIRGIVGESGCGKTTLALSVLNLLPPTVRLSGSILIAGKPALGASRADLLAMRRGKIAYVPQDPLASLDPTFSVGYQIAEVLRACRPSISRRKARAEAIGLMERVGIQASSARYRDAPHRFSGGMRQRIAIAMALATSPSLIVADEPTTALDVTVQRQVLELLASLATGDGLALCLITHDLDVVADVCDTVSVMYAGRVVEQGDVAAVLTAPEHPYTRALLEATPRSGVRRGELPTIPGYPPILDESLSGCAFAPRCAQAAGACAQVPPLRDDSTGHSSACWFDSRHPRDPEPPDAGEVNDDQTS